MRGQHVGRYLLEGVIGVGSFATVHRAVDERLDDTVVLKVLAENHSLNPEIRERFITEGRALRRVDSPHVVTVHDIGESDRQQPYLVLEHADRGTLAERVALLRAQGWTADADDVLEVARPLAAALEAVHAARLVHRDLSPSNILLTSGPWSTGDHVSGAGSRLVAADERLLVADLGLCKDLAVSSGLTVAGGTSGYRPPEMESGPAVVDARADLWSLSSLVLWLADGAELPAALWQTLDRGRSTHPADRQPDAPTWLAEVESALAPEPAAPPTDAGATAELPSRTLLVRYAAALLLALVLGVGGGWLLHGAGAPSPTTQSASIDVDGPEQARVGEEVTFTLRHVGVDSWVWVLPTGEHVAGLEAVRLTPSGAGSATVLVRSRDAQGRDLAVEHRLTVLP